GDLRDLGVESDSQTRDPSGRQGSHQDDVRSAILLLLILILAGILRIHGIGDQSLWFDESATVRIVRQGFGEMFGSIREGERIPPLHYLILWVWVRVFGHADWSVRLPSALAGTAAVWVLYLLTRRLFGAGAALAAALLLAVAPFQVDYSQEARSYSLLLLLSLLSCDLFVRILREPKPRGEAAYVLVSAAALYSHLYAVFTFIAQAIAYALAWTRPDKPLLRPRRWVVTQIGIIALFLWWVPTAIRWTKSVGAGFWLPPASGDDLWAAYLTYAGGSIATVLLLAVLLVIGVAEARRRNVIGLALMFSLATLPVFLPVIASILTKPTFTPRYGIVAPAALYALVGCGVIALRNRAAQGIVVAALVALSFNAMAWMSVNPDWRGAVAHLDRVARRGDYVVMTPRLSTYLWDRYATRTDYRRKGFDAGAIPLSVPLADGVTVWFVYEPAIYPANSILARGGWQIRSSRRFEGLIVLELDDG
ncbi:MAG: glycosyltransferase family 39 protein, partial [Tepidisphaeraceae bacterium]